ncbi:hypothetical protein [Streptomyces sp. NPDC007346]|uniref:hypothetical protein n=1 Tax=Streptomyces sp. NPDC007346 TaxID=3154682 RepID=UPI003451FF15
MTESIPGTAPRRGIEGQRGEARRNVALASDNISRMREALASYDRELERGAHLAPLVRHRLSVRRQEIADFLAATVATKGVST